MPKTRYLSNAILNHISNNAEFTMPTTLYIGLFTVAPTVNSDGTEVEYDGTATNGYARKAITFATTINGKILNSADVTFDMATASWGTIVAIGIFDDYDANDQSVGELLAYDWLSTPRTILMDDNIYFGANQVTWEES